MTPAEEDALIMQCALQLGNLRQEMDAPVIVKLSRLIVRAAVAHERERAAMVCENKSKEWEDFSRHCSKIERGDSAILARRLFVECADLAAAIRRGTE